MNGWTALERRWRDVALEAVMPGFAEVDHGPFWAALDRAAPPLLRLGFRVAVWTVTWAPPLALGRLRTLPRLPPADRDRLLARLAGSRLYLARQLVTTLKLMACFAYLRAPAVRARYLR